MNFNVHKWNKQRYLAEAGLQESIPQKAATAIDKILDEIDPSGILPEELGEAIAIIVKKGYQAELQERFMDALQAKLGMKPLNEEAEESTLEKIASELKPKYPELKFDPTSDRIDVFGDENDKVGFANAERKTKFEDGYRMFDVEDDDRGYMVRIVKNK